MTIAKKILNLRKGQGLSQEELADKASINLRTLQRIEQGHTEPRGLTLRLIANALGQSPEDLLSMNAPIDLKEDPTFLQLLNLSALAIWLIPFGNLIIPAFLWWKYRDTIVDAKELGRQLLRFQLIWSCLTYGLLFVTFAISIVRPEGVSPFFAIYPLIVIGLLLLLNTFIIITASFQLKKGRKPFYVKILSSFNQPKPLVQTAFLISIGLGVSITTLAQNTEAPHPSGKMVNLGGWRLHILEQGAQHTYGPSVILEAGSGDFSFDWALVQPKVAEFARVYSYDRAGLAWSELGPRPHTMQQTVYNLHCLLQKAQVPKPYILVGASLGGILVRLYEQTYPDEIAGLILVDGGTETGRFFINGRMQTPEQDSKGEPIPPIKTVATPEDNNLARTPEAVKAIGDALNKIGLPAKQVYGSFRHLPDSIQKIRLWALGNYEYYAASNNTYLMDELLQMIKVRAQKPQSLGNKPLIVITRGKPFSNDTEADEQKRLQDQKDLMKLSSQSKQIIAHNSGHHIQLDEPDVVVAAIRDMVMKLIKK
ncbi:alpha/beta fold hydrolase [Emticicia sp. BO119]|uniref:alpha/beta fold hydrolase n=1 Tax=Emticicia sp. BO119 TaxID=2757768 RepID=UPI0015EFE55F|nr:alpha/beta fold hydrolase [Emticicia sp. BO119]MBA4849360.1 alpha/beta fold hydrolase [Emticicia sp. BO119]